MNCAANPSKTKRKWATFTYVGKEIRHITKLFKNTNFKIEYRTNDSIGLNLRLNT